MSEWTFRLIIAGVELTDIDIDALFEAGCDDATFAKERDGSVLGLFDREADTPEAAVLSALVDVEAAGIDARVVPDNGPTLSPDVLAEANDRLDLRERPATGS